MEDIKQISYYNNLFDHYQELLTEKQKAYFMMYYHNDYSLSEIADFYGISRNAVYDLINVAIRKLEEYESILKLHKKKKERQNLLNKYLETKDDTYLNKLIEMDDE